MKYKELQQTEKTKKFINGVNNLIDSGLVKNYSAIIKELGWEKTMFSNVLNGRRNVPNDIYKKFTEVYQPIEIETNEVPDIRQIDDKDIQSRLLRIEANLEVFQIAIAGLNAKRKEDFGRKFSELLKLIEEAVLRRKGLQP